jgi:nucleotide-binding universal stress UspA family protein
LRPLDAPGPPAWQASPTHRGGRRGLKDILVQLDAGEASASRLDIAAELAARHGAHLVGLHVADATVPFVAAADASGAGLALVYDTLRTQALETAPGWRPSSGARAPRRPGGRMAHGRGHPVRGGDAARTLRRPRRAGSVRPERPDFGAGVVGAVLFGAGRPVLVVPYAGRFSAVGRRVLVAWNASREAARAVNDALPILEGAEAVTVLAVNPRRGIGGHGEEPAADIALHLARHGVTATTEQRSAPEVGDAEALLNAAAEKGADLLVMGGYGHSRLREMALGGVTRTVLRSMTVPVLLSH